MTVQLAGVLIWLGLSCVRRWRNRIGEKGEATWRVGMTVIKKTGEENGKAALNRADCSS